MGVQIQAHTQVHQPPPPPPRHPDTKRQFLSTLVPLTACVAGQRDDFSYYTLAQPGSRASIASSHCTEYSVGDIDKALIDDDTKKVAPDVIVGTPGQETDELAAFVQQEANRTESLKKRYGAEHVGAETALSDEDDEQNDYGFNKRPHVKGIKSKLTSSSEILQEMQDQLSQSVPTQQVSTITQWCAVIEKLMLLFFRFFRCQQQFKPKQLKRKLCTLAHYHDHTQRALCI